MIIGYGKDELIFEVSGKLKSKLINSSFWSSIWRGSCIFWVQDIDSESAAT